MSASDLLNDFAAEADKQHHLHCYRGLIRRARPYTLDDDATSLITELASGPTIRDKLPTYRILARLPFDVVWIELNYDARYLARVALGTSVGEKPVDVPDRIGWLMERIDDTTWRATTVFRYSTEVTGSERRADVFPVVHIVSTEGPLAYSSKVKDPDIRAAVEKLNEPLKASEVNETCAMNVAPTLMWGFGVEEVDEPLNISRQKDGGTLFNISLPSHLNDSNAIDLAPSWEPLVHSHSDGTSSSKRYETLRYMTDTCKELKGDLRFLMAALATINEVPLIYADVRRPGTRRIGGGVRPYMMNRVVTIAIPKKIGRTNKVMKMLRLAEVRMRRHEVSGHWKRVRFKDGRIERRWITEHMRGDASLGYVRQEREVVKA